MIGRRIVSVILTVLLCSGSLSAQNVFEKRVSFDKVIHDFGDILVTDGTQVCTFTMKNISDEPVVIHSVLSSCGCTEPQWTKAPIRPGETGMITVSYLNDQGAYPFVKNLTVYISGLSKPVILKITGDVHQKELSLKELYPVVYGPVGFKAGSLSAGYIGQGGNRSVEIEMANISSKAVTVEFYNMTPGLTVTPSSERIPAKSKFRVICNIDTRKTDGLQWGKTPFRFSIMCNGKRYADVVAVDLLIREDFSALSEKEKKAAALPQFTATSYSCGEVKEGEVVRGVYKFKNIGKTPFRILSVDFSESGGKVEEMAEHVDPGSFSQITVSSQTEGAKGNVVNIITVTTNSPSRPIINLFLEYTVI